MKRPNCCCYWDILCCSFILHSGKNSCNQNFRFNWIKHDEYVWFFLEQRDLQHSSVFKTMWTNLSKTLHWKMCFFFLFLQLDVCSSSLCRMMYVQSLFSHSSAEGGKFLCAHLKSQFKVCTHKHDLWHHN